MYGYHVYTYWLPMFGGGQQPVPSGDGGVKNTDTRRARNVGGVVRYDWGRQTGARNLKVSTRICLNKAWAFDVCSSYWSTTNY